MRRIITLITFVCFIISATGQPLARAGGLVLSPPGQMIGISQLLAPPVLKGIKVFPGDPFRFDFILSGTDGSFSQENVKSESTRLIKYFLATLTVPEKDLWVNLSPFEKNRIAPEAFGQSEMGRDLLAQDYLLKQLTASLIYPEGDPGKKFWSEVYRQSQQLYGTTDISVDAYKVWIMPERATVYENIQAGTAFVVSSRLKVMLEEDYLAKDEQQKSEHHETGFPERTQKPDISKQILRDVIIPIIEKDVNEGANFSRLRQIYQSIILATWFKKKFQQGLLDKVYRDKNKISGINIVDPQEPERIWSRYVESFKNGVYNYIKEEADPFTGALIPRKHFSGGMNMMLSLEENNGAPATLILSDSFPEDMLDDANGAQVVEARIEDAEGFLKTTNAAQSPVRIDFDRGGNIRREVQQEWFNHQQTTVLKSTLKTLMPYFYGIKVRNIAILDQSGDLVSFDGQQGAIQLGKDAFRSPGLLKFSLIRALSAIRMQQTRRHLKFDILAQERSKEAQEMRDSKVSVMKKNARYLLFSQMLDYTILKLKHEALVLDSTTEIPEGIDRIVEILQSTILLELVGDTKTVKAVLAQMPDQMLANHLGKMQKMSMAARVLETIRFLSVDVTNIPWISGFTLPNGNIQPMNAEEYQAMINGAVDLEDLPDDIKRSCQNIQFFNIDQAFPLSRFDLPEAVMVYKKAHPEIAPALVARLLSFARSADIIARVESVNKKFHSIEEIQDLLSVVNEQTLSDMINWYGVDLGDSLIRLLHTPGAKTFFAAIGPQDARLILMNIESVLALPESRDHYSPEIVTTALDWIKTVLGPDVLSSAIHQAPEQAYQVFLSLCNHIQLVQKKHQNNYINLLNKAVIDIGQKRLANAFIKHPMHSLYELTRFMGDLLEKDDNNGEILYGMIREVVFELSQQLTDRVGKENLEAVLDKDPMALMNLSLVFTYQFSMEDLDRIFTDYGKDNVINAWKHNPGTFPLMLILLRDTDPNLMKLLGKNEYFNILQEDCLGFVNVWGKWWSLNGKGRQIFHVLEGNRFDYFSLYEAQHRDVKALGEMLVIIQNKLPWITPDQLRKLLIHHRELLVELLNTAVRFTPNGPELLEAATWGGPIVDDTIPEVIDSAWEAWDGLVEFLGKSALQKRMASNPQNLVHFIDDYSLLSKKDQDAFNKIAGVLIQELGQYALMDIIVENPIIAFNLKERVLFADQKTGTIEDAAKNIRAAIKLGVTVWGSLEAVKEHPLWILMILQGFKANQIKPKEMLLMEAVFGSSKKQTPEASQFQALRKVLMNKKLFLGLKVKGLQHELIERLKQTPDQYIVNAIQTIRGGKFKTLFSPKEIVLGIRYNPSLLISRNPPNGVDAYALAAGIALDELTQWYFSDTKQFKELLMNLKKNTLPDESKGLLKALSDTKSIDPKTCQIMTRNVTVFSLLCSTLLDHMKIKTQRQFRQALGSVISRERQRIHEREGMIASTPGARLQEVLAISELARLGIVDESLMLDFWLLLLDQVGLPLSDNKKVEVLDAFTADTALSARIREILLNEKPGSAVLVTALGIAVHHPALFKDVYAELSSTKKNNFKAVILNSLVLRYFEMLRLSPFFDTWHVNNLIAHLLAQLMNGFNGVAKDMVSVINVPTLRTESNDIFQRLGKTYQMLNIESLRSSIESMGVEADPDLFRQLDPALMEKLMLYSLDNLNSLSTDTEQTIAGFLDGNAVMERYCQTKLVERLRAHQRYSPEYQGALRLTVLSPLRRKIIQQVLHDVPEEEAMLRMDMVNALLANQMNRLLISHADLMLGQEAGQGLVSLQSKIKEVVSPLTVIELRRQLEVLADDWDHFNILDSLDHFRYRVWNGVVIPRLSILESGYRGSRSFDDPEARYVTRAVSVAKRYAWRGGEAADAKGQKVVHQWSFPVIKEKMKILDIASNKPAVVKFWDKGQEIPLHFAVDGDTITISHTSGKLLYSADLPSQDTLNKVSFPVSSFIKGKISKLIFQLGRSNDHVYLMRVDPFVALANHFLEAPGEDAYVRQVSTEGRSDLEPINQLIRMQVIEMALKEEILDGVERLNRARNEDEYVWALRGIQLSLQELAPGNTEVGLSQGYFSHVFQPLVALIARSLNTLEHIKNDDPKLEPIRREIISSLTVQWLQKEEIELKGSFESFDRKMILDRYQGKSAYRRTALNRFLETLRTNPHPSNIIREWHKSGVLRYFLQEFEALSGVAQGNFHQGIALDEHSLRVIDELDKIIAEGKHPVAFPEILYLMGLMHDTGKVEGGRLHGERSADVLKGVLKVLGMPLSMIDRWTVITRVHSYLGQIAASQTKRLAVPRRQTELETESYKMSQRVRISYLAQQLKGNRSVSEALEDLNYLNVLTIAETRAIPFPAGDTQNRYTTLFAQELEEVRRSVEEVIAHKGIIHVRSVSMGINVQKTLRGQKMMIAEGETIAEILENLKIQSAHLAKVIFDAKGEINNGLILQLNGVNVPSGDYHRKINPEDQVRLDYAMSLYSSERASVDVNGGIDLSATPAMISSSAQGIEFYIDPATEARLQNSTGFLPNILNIRPLVDVRDFLGVKSVPSSYAQSACGRGSISVSPVAVQR